MNFGTNTKVTVGLGAAFAVGFWLVNISQAWADKATKGEVKALMDKVWEEMAPLSDSRIKNEINQEHILSFMRRIEERMQRMEDNQNDLKNIIIKGNVPPRGGENR